MPYKFNDLKLRLLKTIDEATVPSDDMTKEEAYDFLNHLISELDMRVETLEHELEGEEDKASE